MFWARELVLNHSPGPTSYRIDNLNSIIAMKNLQEDNLQN